MFIPLEILLTLLIGVPLLYKLYQDSVKQDKKNQEDWKLQHEREKQRRAEAQQRATSKKTPKYY